jgi:hypothetical protein
MNKRERREQYLSTRRPREFFEKRELDKKNTEEFIRIMALPLQERYIALVANGYAAHQKIQDWIDSQDSRKG